MRDFFRTRFRIVTNPSGGFDVQERWWWSPCWGQSNYASFSCIEKAEARIWEIIMAKRPYRIVKEYP